MTERLKSVLLAALLLLTPGVTTAAQEARGDAQELIARGNERYARAEYEAAISLYSRVPASAGELYAQALYNIGVCRFELWQTEEAARAYERAVKARGGRYPKASYALGVALEELKRLPEAKAAYERALALAANPVERSFLERRLGELRPRAG